MALDGKAAKQQCALGVRSGGGERGGSQERRSCGERGEKRGGRGSGLRRGRGGWGLGIEERKQRTTEEPHGFRADLVEPVKIHVAIGSCDSEKEV